VLSLTTAAEALTAVRSSRLERVAVELGVALAER
jgi:hypothetical protein